MAGGGGVWRVAVVYVVVVWRGCSCGISSTTVVAVSQCFRCVSSYNARTEVHCIRLFYDQFLEIYKNEWLIQVNLLWDIVNIYLTIIYNRVELKTIIGYKPCVYLFGRVIQRPHLGLFITVFIPGVSSGPRLGHFQRFGKMYFVIERQRIGGRDRFCILQSIFTFVLDLMQIRF